jgi:hypothetical protein
MHLTVTLTEPEAKEILEQAEFELRTPGEVLRRAFEVYQKRALKGEELELQKLREDKANLLKANQNQANQIKELKKDIEEAHGTALKVSQINRTIASMLKGDPGPDVLHDWSDLPKLVRENQLSLVIARSELSNIFNLAQAEGLKSIEVRAQIGLQQRIDSKYDPFNETKLLTLNEFEYMFSALLFEYCQQMKADPPLVMLKDPNYREKFMDWANGFTSWRSW